MGFLEKMTRRKQKIRSIEVSNVLDCTRYGCPCTPWNWAVRWTLEKCNFQGKEVVCDLGAGDNMIITKALCQSVGAAFLVDIMQFPARSGDSERDVYRIQADTSVLPFAGGSVDIVLSISVLEHLPVDRRIESFKEIHRILKPGGRAVITMGHFIGVTAESAKLLQVLPFFAERKCAVFLPVDIMTTLQAVPDLVIADNMGGQQDEGVLQIIERAADNIVKDAYRTIPSLTAYPSLCDVEVVEVGVVLVKR